MQVETLDLNSYTKYTGTPKWSVDPVYWQMRWFFLHHDITKQYHIICTTDERQKVLPDGYVSLFAKFGINFNRELSVIGSRCYLLELQLSDVISSDVFEERVANVSRAFDNDDVGAVIINYGDLESIDDLSDAEKLMIILNVTGCFKNARIANTDLCAFNQMQDIVEDNDSELANAVSFDEVIDWKPLLASDMSLSISAGTVHLMLQIINLVRESPCELFDASDSELVRRFTQGGCAALSYICLMRFGKRIFFSSHISQALYGMPMLTMKQNAMYADDYLHLIANLPDVAVYRKAQPLLLMPAHDTTIQSEIRMQLLSCEVDMNTFSPVGELETESVFYQSLDVISTAELFNLSSKNFEEAKNGFCNLTDFFKKMYLLNPDILGSASILLNISNVLFYKIDNTIRAGYIAYINAPTRFKAYPIREFSEPFDIELDVSKEILYDVRLFSDWKTMLAPYARDGIINPRNSFFAPNRYINGLCMYCLPSDGRLLPQDCGLTFEEAGMYANSSWSLRQNLQVLNYLKKPVVVKKMATAYGGLHPMVSATVNVGKEDWRSDADKIQQFNTYGY